MAGKGDVSIRLSLDGAAEVKASLNTLKAAGDAFFKGFKEGADSAVPGFAAKIDGAMATIVRGFNTANAAKDRFVSGFARVGTDMRSVGNAAFGIAKRVAMIEGAAVGAITALGAIAKSALDAGDEAIRMAERVGMGVESFTALSGVAETFDVEQGQLVGSMSRLNLLIEKSAAKTGDLSGEVGGLGESIDDLNGSLDDLDDANDDTFDNMGDAAGGAADQIDKAGKATDKLTDGLKKATGEAKKGAKGPTIFEKLGLDVKELAKLSPEERLYKISDALAAIEDPVKRSTAAIELLGKGGGRMLNILSGGSGDLRKAMEEMKRYGVVLTEVDKKVINLADDQQDKLGLAIRGLRLQVGLRLVPALGRASEIFAELIIKNRAWVEGLATTIGKFAELAAIDIGKLLAGDTDGISETNKWMITVRDTILSLKETVISVFYDYIIPGFKSIREYAKDVATVLNGMFGTDFTGDGLLVAAAIGYVTGALTLFVSIGNLAVGVVNLLLVPLKLLTQAVIYAGIALAGLLGLPAAVGIAIVAAIVAAIAAIYYYWDELGPYFKATWNIVVEAARVAFNSIKAIVTTAFRGILAVARPVFEWFANRAWPAIKEGAAAAWRGIVDLAATAFGYIVKGFSTVKQWAGDAWSWILAKARILWDALPKDWEKAKEIIVRGFKAIPGLIGDAWTSIKDAAAVAWAAVQKAAADAWTYIITTGEGIAAKLAPAWESIKEKATALWDGIGSLAQKAWDGVVSIVTQASERVAAAVGAVARKAWEAWTGASQSVEESAQAIVDALNRATEISGDVEGAKALAAALVQPFKDAAAEIDTVLRGIEEKVATTLETVMAKIDAAIDRLRDLANFEASGIKFGPADDSLIIDLRNTEEAYKQLMQTVEMARQAMTESLNRVMDEVSGVSEAIRGEFSQLGFSYSESILTGIADLQAQLPAKLEEVKTTVSTAFATVAAALRQVFADAVNGIIGSLSTLQSAVGTVMSGIQNQFASMVESVSGQIERLKSVLASLTAAIAKASAAANSGGQGKAGGGMIYGSGGPTQDNIPIWASAGEFMIRAAAVKRLPLAFLRALNSGRFDLGDLLHRFSNMRFASGGLISMPSAGMPALALAGSGPRSGSMSGLTLVLGGETFEGLTGPSDTISRLERAAKSRILRSTGRQNPYD